MKSKFLILVAFSFFIFAHGALAAKINVNNNPATMQEGGDSKIFTITLDEPIISPGEDPAYVTINLNTNDNRLILSTSTVTFTAGDWFTSKQFTVTTAGDSVSHDYNNSPQITLSAVSNSEYYSNFTTSVLVTLVDSDPVLTNTSPSHHRGGSTIESRVTNLMKMGNVSEANVLIQQFPNLFLQNSASTTTSTSSIFIRDLKKGMSGKDVLALQQFLINQNLGPLSKKLSQNGTSNYFGNITKSALIEFQKAVGIKPTTGNFDSKTRAYLKSIGY